MPHGRAGLESAIGEVVVQIAFIKSVTITAGDLLRALPKRQFLLLCIAIGVDCLVPRRGEVPNSQDWVRAVGERKTAAESQSFL
jgi:hypothetical protein